MLDARNFWKRSFLRYQNVGLFSRHSRASWRLLDNFVIFQERNFHSRMERSSWPIHPRIKEEELTVASQFHIRIVGIYGVHRGGCSGAVMVVRVHVQRVYENRATRESYNSRIEPGISSTPFLPHPGEFYIQEARLGKKSRWIIPRETNFSKESPRRREDNSAEELSRRFLTTRRSQKFRWQEKEKKKKKKKKERKKRERKEKKRRTNDITGSTSREGNGRVPVPFARRLWGVSVLQFVQHSVDVICDQWKIRVFRTRRRRRKKKKRRDKNRGKYLLFASFTLREQLGRAVLLKLRETHVTLLTVL